jgi:CelD/BcsL family acetyltransferase involved in cellulose biosynthesis
MDRAAQTTASLGVPTTWAAYRPRGGDKSTVQVVCDHAGFAALAGEWDELVARTDDQMFYRHRFLRLWLEHFAPQANLRVLTQRDANGRLVAALPLMLQTARLHGLPVRELVSAVNVHSCRNDLLADDPPAAARAFLRLLNTRADWDLLCLPDVPDGGRAHALVEHADGVGLPTGEWASLDSPYVPLPRSWEQLQKGLSAKFRANLRRRRRRLQEQGQVTLERIDHADDLSLRLDEGLLLESSGWKGRNGTAICQDPATLGFYTELARAAAASGNLALWFLRVDGRAVAFQFGLQHRGRYLLLKPAYDETLGDCSPGQLLTEDVLRDCIARGLTEFDFLGPNMTWKRDWTTHARQHRWLYVFRGARGRLLHSLKFRIGPMARAMVTRWKH